MKIIPISLSLKQLKELCEKKVTDIYFNQGATMIRIKVNLAEIV
jgi:hypothetical protein